MHGELLLHTAILNGEAFFVPPSACLIMRISLAKSSGESITMDSPSMVYCFGLFSLFSNASSMLLSVLSILLLSIYMRLH